MSSASSTLPSPLTSSGTSRSRLPSAPVGAAVGAEVPAPPAPPPTPPPPPAAGTAVGAGVTSISSTTPSRLTSPPTTSSSSSATPSPGGEGRGEEWDKPSKLDKRSGGAVEEEEGKYPGLQERLHRMYPDIDQGACLMMSAAVTTLHAPRGEKKAALSGRDGPRRPAGRSIVSEGLRENKCDGTSTELAKTTRRAAKRDIDIFVTTTRYCAVDHIASSLVGNRMGHEMPSSGTVRAAAGQKQGSPRLTVGVADDAGVHGVHNAVSVGVARDAGVGGVDQTVRVGVAVDDVLLVHDSVAVHVTTDDLVLLVDDAVACVGKGGGKENRNRCGASRAGEYTIALLHDSVHHEIERMTWRYLLSFRPDIIE